MHTRKQSELVEPIHSGEMAQMIWTFCRLQEEKDGYLIHSVLIVLLEVPNRISGLAHVCCLDWRTFDLSQKSMQ